MLSSDDEPVIPLAPAAWIFKHNTPAPCSSVDIKPHIAKLPQDAANALVKFSDARNIMVAELTKGASTANAIKACEEYLPQLIGLKIAALTLPETVFQKMKVQWVAPFTAKFTNSPASLPSLNYEYVMVLMSTAMLLRKLAWEQLADLGKSSDEAAIKSICGSLNKACGIFEYLSKLPLSTWTTATANMIEMTTEFNLAMANLSQSEAHLLMVRKAFGAGNSPNVIGRIAMDAFQKSKHASELIAKLILRKESDEVRANQLQRFLAAFSILTKAICNKYLAAHALSEKKYGVSVAYLTYAFPSEAQFKTLNDSTNKKNMPGFLAVVVEYLEDLNKIFAGELRDNNMVYHEKVETEEKLVKPEPACVCKPIPFAEPTPVTINLSVDAATAKDACSIM